MDILLYATNNPRNLGSIIRTSVVFGLEKLFLYDKFDILNDKKSYEQVKNVCRRNRDENIDIISVENPLEFTLQYENRYATVLSRKSEKMDGSLYFPEDSLVIFGNESEGIPREISRTEGTHKFMIPTKSPLECLSLAEAYPIVLYEYLRQHPEEFPKVGREKM